MSKLRMSNRSRSDGSRSRWRGLMEELEEYEDIFSWSIPNDSSFDHFNPIKTTHPLQNEVVLVNLFNQMNVHELLDMRLVCKYWRDLAAPLIQSQLDQLQVTLGRKTGPRRERLNLGPERIQQYLDYLTENPDCLRFSNFCLRDIAMDVPSFEIVQEFFKNCGPSIRILKLDFKSAPLYPFPETEDDDWRGWNPGFGETDTRMIPRKRSTTNPPPKVFQEIIFEQCKNLEKLVIIRLPLEIKNYAERDIFLLSGGVQLSHPKLKCVKISHCYHGDSMYMANFLTGFFSACPFLTDFRVSCYYGNHEQDECAVASLASSKRLKNLKSLKLSTSGNTVLDTLTYSKVKLSHIQINSLVLNQSNAPALERFLASQSSSLKSLVFLEVSNPEELHSNWEGPFVRFPEMKKLQSMTILINNTSTIPFVRFGPFDYNAMFPNLSQLVLHEQADRYKLAEWFNLDIQDPHLQLREIQLPFNINNPQLVQNIAKLFPNVVDLTIGYQHDRTLQALWTCWPKLECLHLSIKPDASPDPEPLGLDCVLTGFHPDVCKALGKRARLGKPVNLQEIREFPSIVQLKSLKNLVLHNGSSKTSMNGHRQGADGKEDKLTNVGILYALAKMSSLQDVIISTLVFQASPSCIAMLTKELNLSMEENYREIGLKLTKYPDAESCLKPLKWHQTSRSTMTYNNIFNVNVH